MYSQESLGKRISELRKIQELTQDELAKKANISKGYLANLEIGVGESVSMKVLQSLALSLNVSIDYLLCDSLSIYETKELNSEEKQKVIDIVATLEHNDMILFNKILSDFIDSLEKKKRAGNHK